MDQCLSGTEHKILELIDHKVANWRRSRGKEGLLAVLVESDWPEYEKVCAMLDERLAAEEAEEIAGIVQHDFDSYSPRILPDDPETPPMKEIVSCPHCRAAFEILMIDGKSQTYCPDCDRPLTFQKEDRGNIWCSPGHDKPKDGTGVLIYREETSYQGSPSEAEPEPDTVDD